MILSFTGSRTGMTTGQARALFTALCGYAKHPQVCFRHGDGTGSDARAHAIVCQLGFQVEIFPSTHKDWAFCRSVGMLVHAPQATLKRNHALVTGADVLLATPRRMQEEQRSGTWATIRYARKIGVPVRIFWPLPEEVALCTAL